MITVGLVLISFLSFSDPPYNCSGGTHYWCGIEIQQWILSLPSTCNCGVDFIFIDFCNDPENPIPVSFPCTPE